MTEWIGECAPGCVVLWFGWWWWWISGSWLSTSRRMTGRGWVNQDADDTSLRASQPGAGGDLGK